ncbi:uncharacterized protein LOC143284476 isoform X1 [Babylonia areolata]|uniref:uncharacterized protein LOC143284476 isoform X1 n=1 Tax=Babylonia areolata TaxID=304850 RepID=UPI003FD360BC
MANVFDILNRKSSSSAEGTENEQMSRISSRTPGSSDSLQVQGVNNDASAFENKDGAKASGNYAYGVESRQETQEATSPFTIPKLKRSKQDLFMDISTESREWQQEILPSLTKYFRFPQSSSKFEFVRVSMIQNAERTQKYLDKRKEMRQNGYSERDITDSFAFLYVHVDDDKQVEKISREGLHIGNLSSSTIGHPGMGAQLCRYIDTIRPVSFFHGSMGKLLVFKVMKGKVKAVTENRSGPSLEPTPNYDCHMAKCSLDVSPDSQQQFYELYQMYLYEYGEDMTVEPYPRHVLPYAVITFRYKELPPSPRHLDSSPVYSPRLSSPSVPKFTVSAPKEADDPEYVIWCGHLRVKDILDCQVKMVSTASQYKPAHLGTVLNVRDTCEMKVAWERYFKEMSCLRKTGEVYWKGWYINVAELRPRPDSKMQFQRLMNHLGKTESLAVLKPENDVILLLAPNSELTSHLFDDKSRKSCEKGTRSCIGLTRPHHYPMMFYCIFLSRQSSKFKSPGYIQKGLHQRSGSCTPAWVDSGQISPISINVHPSSRPHTAPASPALLSPTLGLSFHSSSDRSPGYGASPRDELAVWTDALSVGRSVGSSSSSICQSAGEEKSDVPTRAHDLLRLHRSLSTDLATHEGPDKTIPLGFDEGFLSAMPLSARVNPQRLKNAFAIQHQIQEGMALSSAEPLLLPSAAAPMLMSHTLSSKELRDDVEQDDTITSSTSLDPSSQPLSRVRSASTDATFSPLPSPENTSEPDEMSVDLGVQSESSVVMVPKETRPRAKSLYIPPPNIPEYKPTPIHEPIAKRYKVDEGSRHSSNIPSFERGSSSLRSSSSSASLPYRSSSLNIPSVGLTHVRSPRDLPLPISPADSSTDKVKSPSPTSSNITTANDMKNFLNASLERKPSSRPSFSLSRSYKTE